MSFAMRHLTQTEQMLLQNSYAVIQPALVDVMAIFFDKLLTTFPEMRAGFNQTNMQIHVRRFAQTLDILVGAVDRLAHYAPHIAALGEQHHHYGVQPSQYATFGETLLWAMEKCLGHTYFTHDVRQAWSKFYNILLAMLVPSYASEIT